MKPFTFAITVFIFATVLDARVLLNRHHRQEKRLYTNYPRYLVPDRQAEQITDSPEQTEETREKLNLDSEAPKERELFMMTNFEAQKARFGQRMKCKTCF